MEVEAPDYVDGLPGNARLSRVGCILMSRWCGGRLWCCTCPWRRYIISATLSGRCYYVAFGLEIAGCCQTG